MTENLGLVRFEFCIPLTNNRRNKEDRMFFFPFCQKLSGLLSFFTTIEIVVPEGRPLSLKIKVNLEVLKTFPHV